MNFTEIDPGFLLPDEVWERVKAAIPPEPLKPKGGRPRMDDRKALNAMFYVANRMSVECFTSLFRSLQYRA
nr:transposase [Kovacikia minuta]